MRISNVRLQTSQDGQNEERDLQVSTAAAYVSAGARGNFSAGRIPSPLHPRVLGSAASSRAGVPRMNSTQMDSRATKDMPRPKQDILEHNNGIRQSNGFSESQAVASMATSNRVQRIKNMCIDKEVLNVLTSCEFAMRLDVTENPAKVDFPSLIARVDRSLVILRLRGPGGRTNEEATLEKRLLETKAELKAYMGAYMGAIADPGRSLGEGVPASKEDTTGEKPAGIMQEVRENIPSLNFLVREDGSVDWDEALASSREVARFGAELWERLNGKEEEEGLPSFAELLGQASVKTEASTEEIDRLKVIVERASQALIYNKGRESETKEQLRSDKFNGKSISVEDRFRLRSINEKVEELRKLITLSELNLDMEKICVYFEKELRDSGTDVADLKLLVAEVNLIERQLTSVMGGIDTEEMQEIMTSERPSLLLSLVDEEELALIKSKVADLKSRLGIEGSPAAPIDWGTIGEVLKSNGAKLQEGLSFYGEGTQILGADLQYSFRLFLKALSGKTLKAREVNIVRRAVRDVFTLVPFIIILIIPLSPVGHVLVFSFLQRYFPGFFPSCYSDKRLNLRRLYSEVSKTDEDYLGEPPKAPFR